jgi:hypothetical protein
VSALPARSIYDHIDQHVVPMAARATAHTDAVVYTNGSNATASDVPRQ